MLTIDYSMRLSKFDCQFVNFVLKIRTRFAKSQPSVLISSGSIIRFDLLRLDHKSHASLLSVQDSGEVVVAVFGISCCSYAADHFHVLRPCQLCQALDALLIEFRCSFPSPRSPLPTASGPHKGQRTELRWSLFCPFSEFFSFSSSKQVRRHYSRPAGAPASGQASTPHS